MAESHTQFATALHIVAKDCLAFAAWCDAGVKGDGPPMTAIGLAVLLSIADHLKDIGQPLPPQAHDEMRRNANHALAQFLLLEGIHNA